MITIVDCGSQLTQNIKRRIQEQEVRAEIVPHRASLDDILSGSPQGIIQSGGQASVYDDGPPLPDARIYAAGVPVLGICFGMQAMAHLLGGRVQAAKNREYGKTRIHLKDSPLFTGIESKEITVWMSHGDIIEQVPPGFEVIAVSENGHPAAMQKGNLYAVQFHPEVDHTEYGRQMLQNFLAACNARQDWRQGDMAENIIAEVQRQAGENTVIGGVSGGVDSTTMSVLMHRAIGERYHALFIDNGLLRMEEREEVAGYLSALGINLHVTDASPRFLERLAGVDDPDLKRKIIGNEFIAVFEEEAARIGNIDYLCQGTLYPDVIESIPVHGASSRIKRHHNVGGLPERMRLKLIEPFRYLFKDEVRKIAEQLGMPEEIVWRHPFPGPGLAVRIKGEVTAEKLALVRQADRIFISEMRQQGFYRQVSQAFAALSADQTVGVMGDGHTYQHACVLRAVVTRDFMTADSFYFPQEFEQRVTSRIVNEVKGINRVYWDKTQKPPGTIELE